MISQLNRLIIKVPYLFCALMLGICSFPTFIVVGRIYNVSGLSSNFIIDALALTAIMTLFGAITTRLHFSTRKILAVMLPASVFAFCIILITGLLDFSLFVTLSFLFSLFITTASMVMGKCIYKYIECKIFRYFIYAVFFVLSLPFIYASFMLPTLALNHLSRSLCSGNYNVILEFLQISSEKEIQKSKEVAGTNLQSLFDEAAKSDDKTLKLENKIYILSSPIVLTQAHSGLKIDGNGATLSSSKIVDFKPEGRLWVADIPKGDAVYSLFINGERATVAQTPNADSYFFVYSPAMVAEDANGKPTANIDRMAFTARNDDIGNLKESLESDLGNVDLDVYMSWINSRIKLDSIKKSPDGKNWILYSKNLLPCKLYQFERNPRFKILNARSALDQSGEFFFDYKKSKLFYIPHAGETLFNTVARYATLSSLFEIRGSSSIEKAKNISIKNLNFAFCNPPTNAGEHMWETAVQAASKSSGALSVENAQGISIQDCKIENVDTYGIHFKAAVWNSKIEDCVLYDCGSGGIHIGTDKRSKNFPSSSNDAILCGENLISNNIICKYGRWHKSGCGVLVQDNPSNTVVNNTIFDGYYTGVSTGWTWGREPAHVENTKVNYNRIHSIGHGVMDDMGGIYVLGVAPNSECIGNVISQVHRHEYGGWGLYNDANSSNFIWRNNYVFETDDGGYYKNFGTDNVLQNNIFVNPRYEMFGEASRFDNSLIVEQNIFVYASGAKLLRYEKVIPTKQILFKKNIYWNSNGKVMFGKLSFEQWQKQGQDAGSFVVNPNLNWAYENPIFDKIGFKAFDVKLAGVQGQKMQKKLSDITKNYKMPSESKAPHSADWDKEVSESMAIYPVGAQPMLPSCNSSIANDIKVCKEQGAKIEKFVRLTDSNQEPNYNPHVSYNCRIKGDFAQISLDLRVNANSCVMLDARTSKYSPYSPQISIANGKAILGTKTVALPINEWIRINIEIPLKKSDSTKKMKVSIVQADKVFFNDEVEFKQDDFCVMESFLIIMPAKTENFADYANVKISAKK